MMYTKLDYILDGSLEPLSVDVYRRTNKNVLIFGVIVRL